MHFYLDGFTYLLGGGHLAEVSGLTVRKVDVAVVCDIPSYAIIFSSSMIILTDNVVCRGSRHELRQVDLPRRHDNAESDVHGNEKPTDQHLVQR